MATDQETKKAAARQRILAHIRASRIKLNDKTANLRRIAAEEPHEVGNALDELSGLFSDIATVLSGMARETAALKENLNLEEPGRTASIRDRVAARRNYARTLRRIANETPEELGIALSEVYAQLDDAASGIEALAQRFGLPLEESPEEDEEDEAFLEEPVAEAPPSPNEPAEE